MKKLLSLLSVLTISGTAVPTTIAASPYEKENIKNIDINYRQINNLENLNRQKRENKKGFTTKTLKITYNAIEFFKDLYNILNRELGSSENNVVINTLDNNSRQRFFVVNPESDIDYFEIPLNIDNREGFRLVFRASDFYLQGFVIPVEYNNATRQVYYYFDDSEIQTLEGTVSDENLGYNSSYINLVNAQSQEVTWTGIYNSFNELSHFNGNNSNKDRLKKFLAQIILATSESMRFVGVKNLILSTYNSQTILNWERDFSSIINNWSRMTQDAINFYEENNSFNDFAWRLVVLILTKNAFSYVSNSNCNNKGRTSINNEYCFYLSERKIYINNTEFGDYFFKEKKDRKKVVDLDINVKQALIGQQIKNEQDFKQNFSIVSLKEYKSNYKAINKDKWFYNFKLNTSEFKMNDWSYKLISSLEDKAGLEYINGKIYSNYRLYLDKNSELHMQIEIWMEGYANFFYSKLMWIWLNTGYHLNFETH